MEPNANLVPTDPRVETVPADAPAVENVLESIRFDALADTVQFLNEVVVPLGGE